MALGDFDKSGVLSEDARSDVQWWLDNVALEVRPEDTSIMDHLMCFLPPMLLRLGGGL